MPRNPNGGKVASSFRGHRRLWRSCCCEGWPNSPCVSGREKVKMLVTQSCPTLCDPMDCSSPGSSVHGILQARILEWVAISFFQGSSRPRDRTLISCIGRRLISLLVLLLRCSQFNVKDIGKQHYVIQQIVTDMLQIQDEKCSQEEGA